MKCSNVDCRKDIPENVKFCPHCGTPQSNAQPEPNTNSGISTGDSGCMEGNLTDAGVRRAASADNVYIGTQSSDTAAVCPLCGARNLPPTTFRCRQCGQDHLCRTHLNQQHLMCVICARQAEQEAAAASSPQTRSIKPEFCPSCGGVFTDAYFRCVKCEQINCGNCRDDRRRGWCVGCGDEHDRRQDADNAQ